MTAQPYELTIEQGADLDFTVQVYSDAARTVVQDLTGWDARMMIRSAFSSTTILVSLTSNPAAGLTINGPAGQVTVHVAGATTASYTWTSGVYDMEVYNGTPTVRRILRGNVSVSPEVTH